MPGQFYCSFVLFLFIDVINGKWSVFIKCFSRSIITTQSRFLPFTHSHTHYTYHTVHLLAAHFQRECQGQYGFSILHKDTSASGIGWDRTFRLKAYPLYQSGLSITLHLFQLFYKNNKWTELFWSCGVSITSNSKHLVSSAQRNQLMRGDTCRTESCHCHVDRLLPNIDEAKQKYKVVHAWLVELLKIEGPGINVKQLYSDRHPREREVTARTVEPENIVYVFSLLAARDIYLTVTNVCRVYVRHSLKGQIVQACMCT